MGDKFSDETPLFDIRILENMRGKGVGRKAVRWLVRHIFRCYPNKNRIEAATRVDNIGMQKVLKKCGFVKEAHYRQAWPINKNERTDAVGYGILKSDWETKTTTPIDWKK